MSQLSIIGPSQPLQDVLVSHFHFHYVQQATEPKNALDSESRQHIGCPEGTPTKAHKRKLTKIHAPCRQRKSRQKSVALSPGSAVCACVATLLRGGSARDRQNSNASRLCIFSTNSSYDAQVGCKQVLHPDHLQHTERRRHLGKGWGLSTPPTRSE